MNEHNLDAEQSDDPEKPRLIRVMIVDDSEVSRTSIAALVRSLRGVWVAAVASGGLDALKQLSWAEVDLLLTDLNMADMNGLELTRQVRNLPTKPRVVIVSAQNCESSKTAAHEAGADGFLSKADLSQSLGPLVTRLFPNNRNDRRER